MRKFVPKGKLVIMGMDAQRIRDWCAEHRENVKIDPPVKKAGLALDRVFIHNDEDAIMFRLAFGHLMRESFTFYSYEIDNR